MGKYAKFRSFVSYLAELDCLMSGALTALHNQYTKPQVTEEDQIVIVEGRHPIVEFLMNSSTGSTCIPNSISLQKNKDGTVHKAMLLSGPNMGGKTSFTRQIALLVILTQIGSFIPATSAKLCPVDGIFTRMGAHDNEAAGESTFFVEIKETSYLMTHLSSRSLVILDELGRGTSTHDGVAIAYGTLEYLVSKLKPWTLFVTHYPGLALLENKYPGLLSCHHVGYIVNEDDENSVEFTYKIKEGLEKRSYGLNVAQLANIPNDILTRAKLLSQIFEKDLLARQNLYFFKQINDKSKTSKQTLIDIKSALKLR